MNCLYILEINPITVASFVNIFFHSIFVYGFPAMQKLHFDFDLVLFEFDFDLVLFEFGL